MVLGKCLRETARQLRIDRETICTWRDKFRSTGEVKDRSCEDSGWHQQDMRQRVLVFKAATFLMWLRVNQMSRTLVFHTYFSQTRYQIKANTQTHKAKHTELFLWLSFLKKSIFFLVRRNFFEQVCYLIAKSCLNNPYLIRSVGMRDVKLLK